MRLTSNLTMIVAALLGSQVVYADIYIWTDENGITNFTNQTPPPEAEIYLKSMEGPYQEAVDRTQREMEKQRALEQAQAEKRLQEERLAEKIARLERQTAEAERKTREALERVEELEDAAAGRDRDRRWSSTGYVSYDPGYDDYRHYGYRGYRFSVTYPGDKRHQKHRLRKGKSHKQIDRSDHRHKGRRLESRRHVQPRQPPTGQDRFDGHRRKGSRR